jgi:hypothetical protein
MKTRITLVYVCCISTHSSLLLNPYKLPLSDRITLSACRTAKAKLAHSGRLTAPLYNQRASVLTYRSFVFVHLSLTVPPHCLVSCRCAACGVFGEDL